MPNKKVYFLTRKMLNFLSSIKAFSDSSITGEISEIRHIPENSTIWPMVTSTKENCLGQECEFYKECF